MSSNNVVLWQGFHGGQQTDLSQSPQGVSDNWSVPGTDDQCYGQMISARDRWSVLGTDDQS